MIPRQKELLKNIIEEYVKTASPVGSKLIVEKFHMDVSPATVRNDMAELEDLGFIRQPHTSAGRIPTEDGYKYYVENFVKLDKELEKKDREEINTSISSIKSNKSNNSRFEDEIKTLAKVMADKSNQGIIVRLPNHGVYYTGLSNLFSQYEFQDLELISSVTEVFDHLDEMMDEVYDDFTEEVEVLIGNRNPFSDNCSIVVSKNNDTLFGIVGPKRMDYQRNIELINFIKHLL